MGRTIESHSVVVWKSTGHIKILTASILPSIHFPFAPRFIPHSPAMYFPAYATLQICMSNVPLTLPCHYPVFIYSCAYVCVCVRERERERKSECACVHVNVHTCVHVCVGECVHVCVCVCDKMSVYPYVFVRSPGSDKMGAINNLLLLFQPIHLVMLPFTQ